MSDPGSMRGLHLASRLHGASERHPAHVAPSVWSESGARHSLDERKGQWVRGSEDDFYEKWTFMPKLRRPPMANASVTPKEGHIGG